VVPAQEQEKEVALHEESSAPFSFITKPHATSMAVWDVPSPIVFNAKFKLKVGVKCSAECELTGKEIEIYNQEGSKVAAQTLGSVPWTATGTLYWTEVELKSPGTEGAHSWTAKFPEPDLELPHEGDAYTFGFRTVRPPECEVTVEVIDKDTKTPIKNAVVILRPYQGATDDGGVARVRVPKGDYELYVWRVNRWPFQTTVKVASDIAIKAELVREPDFSNWPYSIGPPLKE
jgi:hypothetical protein